LYGVNLNTLFQKIAGGSVQSEQLSSRLLRSEDPNNFLLHVILKLLLFLKDFSLDLEEIKADEYRQDIEALSDRFESPDKTKKTKSYFEKHQKKIASFIHLQKSYLRDREKELRDIIDLLTKALSTLDTDNADFNQKIYTHSEKIEQITLLDDIRKVKFSLAQEIAHMRKTVKEKETRDSEQLEKLSRKVSILNTELQKAREESLLDGLTDIYNRKAFDNYIYKMIKRNTTTRSPFSMLLIDIDNFKRVNDSFGHQVGDRVLAAVAKKCGKYIREQDFLARYGGEEFVIVLPGASLKNATKKSGDFCRQIASTRYSLEGFPQDRFLSLTVSIGISTYRKADTVATLTERADKALYAAKQAGKNRAVSEKDLR